MSSNTDKLKEAMKKDVLGVRHVPKRPPQDLVSEYMRSKCEAEAPRHFLSWDWSRRGPVASLTETQHDMFHVERSLALKRVSVSYDRGKLEENVDHIRQRQVLLKASIMKHNRLIMDNDVKRERAGRRRYDDFLALMAREDKISELQSEVTFMSHVRELMGKQVEDYAVYKQYLDKVVECCPKTFQTSYDILNRYETLLAARDALAEQHERAVTALTEVEITLMHLTEDKAQAIMGMNNKLAELQLRYDAAKASARRWEAGLNRVTEAAVRRLREVNQVRCSVWDLYQRMCKRMRAKVLLNRDDTEKQLLFIKHSIECLKRVLADAVEMEKGEIKERNALHTACVRI